MARWMEVFSGLPLVPELVGERVVLRTPHMSHWREWASLRQVSREFLQPWEPKWAHDELTRNGFRRRLRYYANETREHTGYAFFLFRKSDGALVGGLTLSNIRGGIARSGTLGYWIGVNMTRQGYMRDALDVVQDFAFETLHLHRLEAACVPTNKASRELLRVLGFHEEGYARAYLKINDVWEDHLLFAKLADDPR